MFPGKMNMTVLRPVQENLLPLMEYCREEKFSVFPTAINENPLHNIPNVTYSKDGKFEHGPYRYAAFTEFENGDEHLVLIRGDISQTKGLLVRIHASFLPGEISGLMASDDREQLNESLRIIHENGKGILIYLLMEGGGNRMASEIAQLGLTNEGISLIEAFQQLGVKKENRNFKIAGDILKILFRIFQIEQSCQILLLTNNAGKYKVLQDEGFPNVSVKNLAIPSSNKTIEKYLQSKKDAGLYFDQ